MSSNTPIDYQAEFTRLEAEIIAIKRGFSSVLVEANMLCDNVTRFKGAMDKVEALERAAQDGDNYDQLLEARNIKGRLWDAIQANAEEVQLRISQLPPGATFIDAKFDDQPTAVNEPGLGNPVFETQPTARMRMR